MSKFIRTFLIGIAVLGMGAEVHAQEDVDCIKCVDASDIAPAAVTTGKIRKKAVTTTRLAPQSVTTGKIKNGAVTVNKVSPKLSNAIGTSCPAGESVVGIDASGNLVCEPKLNQAPDTDLTGRTFCYINPFSELLADTGNSAEVTTGLVDGRLDFTSPTQFTNTELTDSTSAINLPANTMTNVDDVSAAEMGTYTVVGNRLALTFDDDGESQTIVVTLTSDGQVFVAGFFGRSVDGSINEAETGILVGVQADSCD